MPYRAATEASNYLHRYLVLDVVTPLGNVSLVGAVTIYLLRPLCIYILRTYILGLIYLTKLPTLYFLCQPSKINDIDSWLTWVTDCMSSQTPGSRWKKGGKTRKNNLCCITPYPAS